MIFSSVREFMEFTGKIIVERTSPGQRASVAEQGIYAISY